MTVTKESDPASIKDSSYQEKPPEYDSVQIAFDELEKIQADLKPYQDTIPRDIDNREWLMSFINFNANRDLIIVQNLYENLKYRDWTVEEKTRYIHHYYFIDNGLLSGTLMELRGSVWDEMAYLLKNSLLLQDTPWMVRDYYDEKCEFSYWYLIYLASVNSPLWIDETILPAMRRLIPEDRITGVSYLWLKNPESLCNMRKEIVDSGYPWNKLLSLMDMNEFIQEQLTLINQSETKIKSKTCIF